MSTAAVTIPNTLPAVLVAISAEARDQIAALEAQAADITAISCMDEYTAADQVLAQVVKAIRELENERKRIKAPILDLGRQLDEAASEAGTGLLAIKASLGQKLLTFQQAENRRRDEERQRLEAQRREAEEQARRAREIEEHNRLELARAAAETANAIDEVAPWEEAPAPVAPVLIPVVEAPTIEQQFAAAPLKSSAVVSKTIKRVEITDASLVPREFGGVQLWTIDTKAVEKLAKAGAQIPGVTVSEVQITAAKG